MRTQRLTIPAIVILTLILLVGAGVTAGLISAKAQADSTPPPEAAAPTPAGPPPAPAHAETARSTQPDLDVPKSGGDTPSLEQGLTVNWRPAVSGNSQYPIPEKAELTYPNLGSALDQMVAGVENGESTAREAAQEAPVSREESVAVTIYLSGNVDDVVTFLEDNGGSPRNVGEDYIEAYVPVTLLGKLSEQPGVLRVREIPPAIPAQTPLEVTGHGPAQHFSQSWNRAGITGQGIKVGITDTGFEGFQDLMGTELPITVEARCYTSIGEFTNNLDDCENGDNHGTKVAESLIDIAPEVSLYIANGISQGDDKVSIEWMLSQGVSIINNSAGWPFFDGPGDGTSPYSVSPLKTVDHATAEGAVWLNSAGNEGQSAWFGPFSDPDSDRYHNFDGDIEATVLPLQAGEPFTIELRWEDTWGQPETDLDLHIFHSNREHFVAMEEYQTGPNAGDFPIPSEHGSFEAPQEDSYDIVILRTSGPPPEWVQLIVHTSQPLIIHTPGGSIGNPAESNNPGMLAVGAAPWYDEFTIEPYSSRGPTPDGRVKPDVVGADCGATSLTPLDEYGEGFCGTSQASPHVAGMAALVRQRFSDYSPVQVANYLKDSSYQFGTPDPNNTWGYGFAALRPAFPPDAPIISVPVTAGPDSLSIIWESPTGDEYDEPVTSYDLRHILTGADGTVESNWTVLDDVGALDSRQHMLTGLTGGTSYGVQVRGVNYWGEGEWSTTATGTPQEVPLGMPTIGSVSAGTGSLTVSWSTPSGGASGITAYDLRYISTDADETVDANWTVEEDVWTTGFGSLEYVLTGLTDGTQYDVQVRAVNSAGDGPWSATATGTPQQGESGATATRSFSPTSVLPNGEVTVTVAVADYGTFGGLTENLPEEFAYKPMSSNLDDAQVVVNGQTVRFTLTGVFQSVTYVVTASSTEGSYSFSGTLIDSSRQEIPVGGALTIAVTTEDPLVARYDANGNGTIEKSEVIAAINDYLFGAVDEAISKSDVIKLINLYLFG